MTEHSVQLEFRQKKLKFLYGKYSPLEIEVVDNSKWNFLEGNKVIKRINLTIDTKKPVANVLSNSRY
ncbi:MAG: M23 family peptidase, partial [Verrucomicrobiota bacterium]|nr:M23 family peptidase [Verrucomicrobiota bacterium]